MNKKKERVRPADYDLDLDENKKSVDVWRKSHKPNTNKKPKNKLDHPWKKPFSWNAKKQQNEILREIKKYGIE
jgi:hypothetical protein